MSSQPATPSTPSQPDPAAPDTQDAVIKPVPHLDPEQASTNFYWTAGQHEVFNFQTTIRGILTEEQIKAHLDSVIITCRNIVDGKGGHAKQVGSNQIKTEQAPAPATPSQPAAPGKPAAPASPKAPAAPASTPSQPAAVQVLIANRMEVDPASDGKVKISFFAAGHKYADLYSTRTVENWIAALAPTGPWGAEHFDSPTVYDVNYRIEWRNSDKLNTKGNPYKDIITINPA